MLEIKNIYKTYSSKNGVTHRALENVSLKFANKGLIFILGKSGSGKSTLLNIIGGLDDYDRGEVIFNGKNMREFKEEDFNYYRNSCIGFIFQEFNLINSLSVYDNVALSLDLQNKEIDEKKIDEILKQVNVDSLKNRKVNELSGGQKQRVAIARALIKDPKIILADEPTGSLDSENSEAISEIIKDLSKDRLVIVVTHNKELAYQYGDRIIEIKDGFVLKDLMRKDVSEEKVEKSTLASSSLVIVPENQKISEENINDLNVTISEKRQDYYLLVDSNKNRVMSLYPNVKEIIDDEKSKEVFAPYHHKKGDVEKLETTKYSLSTKKGIKLGLANVKRKVGKLFFTILLAIISVLITGVASNISSYTLADAIGMSIEKEKGEFLEVSSSFSVSNTAYKLNELDINYLNTVDEEIAYTYEDIYLRYSFPTKANFSKAEERMASSKLFTGSFNGMIATNDIESLGYKNNHFKIIYERDNIDEEMANKGIYISSIVAETIVKCSAYDNPKYSSIEELIDLDFKINSNYYPVLGIYDIDNNKTLYNTFKSLDESRVDEELLEKYESIKPLLTKIVVKPAFIEYFKDLNTSFDFQAVTYNIQNQTVFGRSITKLESLDTKKENLNIEFYQPGWSKANFNEKIKSLKPNQVFIGKNVFMYLTQEKYSGTGGVMPNTNRQYNNKETQLIVKNLVGLNSPGSEVYLAIEGIEVMGVVTYENSNSGAHSFYLPSSAYDTILDRYYMPNRALIPLNNTNDHGAVIQDLYDNGYRINNSFVESFLKLSNTFEQYSTFISVIIVIWFIIVTLLLYSFMSSSIKGYSKQIGVLKALGAKNSDLYKVYSVEAIIIALFSIVIGVGLYFAVGSLVNSIVSSLLYDYYFPIFVFNPISVIVMVISTILILLVSVIIPLSRLKNIKPIEVINSAE